MHAYREANFSADSLWCGQPFDRNTGKLVLLFVVGVFCNLICLASAAALPVFNLP